MKNRIEDLNKKVAAWVVLKDGEVIAKVHAWYSPNGVLVNVADYTQEGWQHSRGGDLNSALSGCIIDNHVLVDDCEVRIPTPGGQLYFPVDFVAPEGYALYNYRDRRAGSCFKIAGLELLTSLGYRVIQAI